jgi:hypothetical protein
LKELSCFNVQFPDNVFLEKSFSQNCSRCQALSDTKRNWLSANSLEVRESINILFVFIFHSLGSPLVMCNQVFQLCSP